MKKFLSFTAISLSKVGLFLLPAFLWLQACSQSPSTTGSDAQSHSILVDTSGVAMGDSPDRAYRLFKFTRQEGNQSETDLKLLRLKDLKEIVVATTRIDPKVYWSSDSKYLVTENSVPDSAYQREVVLFDLNNFDVYRRKQGQLLNYDLVHNIVFMYTYEPTRQNIVFYKVDYAEAEQRREVIAAPGGKTPVAILSPIEKKAKVKVYGPDGVPVNIAFNY